FGASGEEIVIEEFLVGEEASQLCFVQGETLRPLAAAQDHKPVCDGDRGPNTGGMGAYSPAPILGEALAKEVEARILRPTVDALAEAGAPFSGLLYAGLMIGPHGPQVVEFNCRFGDPETQVVLPRLKTDLLAVMTAVCDGRLAQIELDWRPQAAVCVALASGGYPGAYRKGLPITGVQEAAALPDVHIFHAGTALIDGRLVTNGGRVLNVVGVGDDIAAAKARAYEAAAMIHFDGVHYRRDIADKALKVR
ncbi:MAG TPA: phosphoribosylamine--glycine ligase, partial [Limnochordia bacterium]|nr:phosphoribosylamine--glycine ligase [Limnochordia bacterium]